MSLSVKVNGKKHSVDVDDDTPLLWVLRDVLGMTGTKFGCGAACVFATDIVPALPVCNALAKDYEDQPVLQLNVDG